MAFPPIGEAEEAELTQLLGQCQGNEEAENHVSKVLSAVSGYGGMHNAAAIMGDQLADSVKEAEVLKAEANGFFSEGKFDDALLAYQKTLDVFKEYSPTMLDSAAKKLHVAVYSNSAQTCLKLGVATDASSDRQSPEWHFNLAREMADKALALEPTNVKARFRRGCAFAQCKDFSEARADFEWTLRVEPSNDAAKRELRNVLKQMRGDKSDSQSFAKGLAAGVKSGQSVDPRSTQPSATAAPMPIEKQVERQMVMAKQMQTGAAKYFESKGRSEVWKEKQDVLRFEADILAQTTLAKVQELQKEGANLEESLGPRGAPLAGMNPEQQKCYIEADAFITSVKEAFPDDFKDIVKVASTS